ncbi:hypothetical protein BUALT_Bualt02G0210500 [Buddleja alternifolia]|uniref:Uncharacterized protein n=1 Tax=Buddleja alternifolia TaxID=168488 RepID=A0AAV6YCT5_9LAMI|nr:hypothetical protein BUALT_Bualt02G0210500 [Buddleja alternifolia]
MYSPSDDDVLIFKAAASGDLKHLQQLAVKTDDGAFRRRCEISNDCEGKTVLHYAAGMGRIQICKFLIEKQCGVCVFRDFKSYDDHFTASGNSPLLLAVIGGHINTAKYLIIRGADIAMCDSRGATSLHHAAGKENKELMQSLLLKGADIEAKSVDGTPLQFAASRGSVESIRFLLSHGAKPNSVAPLTYSPILLAIIFHSSDCLELLLKAGADPNMNTFGTNPLAYAAMKGETEVIQSLLAAGANPNAVDKLRVTPVEYAALAGEKEVLRVLFPVTRSISDYPDWNIDGIIKYIHSEKVKKKRERKQTIYLKLMKQKGKNAMNRDNYSDAIKWYNEAIYVDSSDANLLLDRSFCWANLNEAAFALTDAEACVKLRPHWPKAHYAEGVAWKLRKNYVMSSKAFANAWRLDPTDEDIVEAFREATSLGMMDLAAKHPLEALKIYERIIKARFGSSPMEQFFSLLHSFEADMGKLTNVDLWYRNSSVNTLEVAAAGNLERLRQLRADARDDQGFRKMCETVKDSKGLTVLHYAAFTGKTQVCRYLIGDVKMNIDLKTDKGDTPLSLAVMEEHFSTANYLINHDADVNASCLKGMTALHYAAENGADIEADSDYGTPLQRASSRGKKEAVKTFLDHNSNTYSASPLSMTPVMLSIMAQSFECLDMLLKAGADPNCVSCGMTPLSYTASESENEFMKFLLKAGANPNVVGTTGMTPLEYAAMACNHEGLMTLFPLTTRITSIPVWSFQGIMNHIHSKEARDQRELKRKENFLLAKQNGEAAVKRNEYLKAIVCYTEAIFLDPTDATMLSNRSLCWARLNDGKRALSDAEACIQLNPHWPKAHYREGVAWTLLKNYSMASEAFSQALKFDPQNQEIQKAFKDAVEAEFGIPVSDKIRAMHISL